MNRGIHEGEVGVGVYYYDALSQTVEEEVTTMEQLVANEEQQ